MFEEQNGCCAICQKHQSKFSKALNVDHDHETGEIRSLLCENCNRGLGLFYENPKNLLNAIIYLARYGRM